MLGGQDFSRTKIIFSRFLNLPTIWHTVIKEEMQSQIICAQVHFQTFLFAKQRFLTEVTLFKELSQIFKDYCGKIKDFSRTYKNFSNFNVSSRTWHFLKDYSRPCGCICHLLIVHGLKFCPLALTLVPYLPMYRSTFYSLNIGPKNRNWPILHGLKTEVRKSLGQNLLCNHSVPERKFYDKWFVFQENSYPEIRKTYFLAPKWGLTYTRDRLIHG